MPADVEQPSLRGVCLALHELCLAAKHVAACPVIDAVHHPLAGVGVADVVGGLVVAAYLLLGRRILRHQETAMRTTTQLEHLPRCVTIYTRQDRFKLIMAAQGALA